MHTPAGKKISFLFGSHPMKDPKMRWQARLDFPDDAGNDGVIGIFINDGEENPVASAVFEYAGLQIPIRDGRGSLTCGEFIRGKHETSLWLHRRGMPSVPGGLTFG